MVQQLQGERKPQGHRVFVTQVSCSHNVDPYLILPFSGSSMRPTLVHGDQLVVSKVYELRVGDIFVFKDKNGELVAHRLQKVKNNEILIKGDWSTADSEWIKKDKIIGKVIGYKRGKVNSKYVFSKNYFSKILETIIPLMTKSNKFLRWGGLFFVTVLTPMTIVKVKNDF